jgi:aminotransferase
MRQFVSARVQSIPSSGIRRFFDIAATMDDVISLGVGEPDFVTPAPLVEAGIRSLQKGDTHYTSNSGIFELRQALSMHLSKRYGVHYDPEEEILLTIGVSEALYLVMTAILDPGDEVIVPEPCFVSFSPEVALVGGVPKIVDTRVEDEFQVTGPAVEAAITDRTKAILLSYPNNPTGAVMSRERLLEIAALAEKYDLLVISDEIYDRLVYGIEHICFASLPGMHKRTVTLGGFSKDYAMTGWRLGYAAAPADILSPMRKIHQYTIMSASTMSQVAAITALEEGEPYVEEMRAEYDRRRRLIVGGLNQLGLKTFEPRGAFYAFPSVAASGMSDEDFAEKLLTEEQVAVVPGNAFGACGTGYVRCCYATAYDKIEQALERIERFMRQHG